MLTGWLRTRPHPVVLLDEIDKAHPRVRELLLGMFDAGRVADGRGMQVTGEHALFIATAVSSSGDPRIRLGAELVGRLDAIIAGEEAVHAWSRASRSRAKPAATTGPDRWRCSRHRTERGLRSSADCIGSGFGRWTSAFAFVSATRLARLVRDDAEGM